MTIGAQFRKQARLALVFGAIIIAFFAAIFPQGANPALGNAQVGDATSSVRTTTGGGGDWARDCPNGYVLAGSYLRPTTISEGFFTVYQVISLFGGSCIQVSSSGLAVGPGIHDIVAAGSNPNNNQESTHCGFSGASVAIGARVFKTPGGRASGLQFICRDLPAALASTERFLGRIGAASDGNRYEDIRCPTGTVARGLFLGESSIVERIGFRCGSITGATQTVSFGALSSRIAGEPSFRVSASTNGAGTLGYSSSTAEVCTTSGNRVSVLSAGTCTITATATSTTNWAQASAAQSFTVQPAPDLPLSTIDYAISLDGVKNGSGFSANGEFLRTATSTGMRDGNNSLMIEAWVKPASVAAQDVVFAKNFSFLLRASTNGWILNAGNGSSWPIQVLGPPVALNQWSHVAVVVTATEHKLYVNGGLVATAASGGHIDNTNVVSVGAYEDGNVPFHGEIDEVKIWVNKDGTDILNTMHTRASSSDTNLQAYWDFNETSGTTVLNRKPGSPNLVHQGNPNRVDVKQETTASNGETIITFPRTYLPGVGHWIVPEDATSARALVVAGGGSGASYVGGGGGGGGVLASTMSTFGSATYSIVVGQGGAPVGSLTSTTDRRAGRDGQNSSAFGLTPVGGGGGGLTGEASRLGGSGGGAGFFNNGPSTLAGGSGVAGQGSSGGSSEPFRQSGGFTAGAGGGGAGESGESSNNALGRGGNGGAGTESAILGSQFFFGGGGGGGAYLPTSENRGGHGGTGGGGAGGVLGANPVTANGGGSALNPGGSVTVGTDFAVAGSGGANTGGGGGGVGHDGISGAGGSGVVIVRYSMATVPTITSQPSDVSVTPGNAATLTVEASGNGTLSYQWEESLDNGATWSVVGTNSDTYATPVLSSASTGGKYRVQVTNTNNGQESLYSDVVTVRLVGVTIVDGPCFAKVGDPTGVSISFVSGGCLVEYSQTGSNTFTVPVNVTSVRALILGAGGGGGAGLPGLRNGGGGGGGGGANNIVSIAVTASQEISITLGQGGAGGNNSDGRNGESSSILYGNSVSSTSVTASGGFGGQMSWDGGGRPGDGGDGRRSEGGTGATHPAERIFERPIFGNACRDVSFASITYCIGGGGGGGNREVANDPFFDFAAGSIPLFNTTLVSGGTGGYHNQTNPVPATSGVPNRGGGGGGGAYDFEQNIGRTGAPGANGLVSFFYIPNAGEVSLSTVAPVSFSQATIPVTLTKENPTTDVTWTTSNTAVCTVTGDDSTGTVTQVAPGQCDVSVRLAPSSSFGVGSANTSFRIDKISRPVAPAWSGTTLSVPFGGTSNLWTKISSPGTNSYRISISGTVGGCSVTGYTLSVGNVGSTCTIDLFHSGDDIYLERQATNQLSVTITKISQSQLVLTSGTAMSVNQTFQLSGAGGTGPGALTYHVANDGSTGCTISDPSSGEISGATSAGSCEVYAKRAASTNYDQVTSSHVLIAIAKIPQVLQWQSQPQAQYVSGNTYVLEATASSQLAVSYTISSGLCSLAGATVTFNGSGDCVVEAFQVGDGGYLAANTISQTVSVGKINQTMTFSAIANKVWGSLAFSLSATASSGLAISYSEDPQTTNDACDVSAQGIVTIKNLGRCAIAAAQAGDVSYTSIERVRVFEVTANQAGAPFIGSISFGDRSLTAGFFAPSYLGGGNISAYQLTAHNPDGTVAATNSGCVANPGPTQSCTVIGLQNGDTYYLRVAAITQAGVGQLSVSTSMVVPASNPEAVGNLIAIEGNGTLTLNWSKPTSFGGGNFFQYRVYWKAPGQSYQPNGAPGHAIGFENNTSYVITGLQNGVAYDVKIITATSNNNLELQSNTAEVNQTPYTVPDAPASAVALENGNNLVIAWQAPVFDGGNPIDRYVVQKGGTTICTITSVSTTSCEVGMPSPGTSNIEVRAGNEAGLSQPAQTTFVVQSVAGSNQVVAGSGGISLPGVTPNTPRPVVTDVSGSAVVQVNDLVTLVGTNMRLVEKVLVGDVEASFFVNSDGLITIRVPVGVPAGKVVITLSGAYGSVFFTDLFEVKTSLQSVDERVTIGTFLGYAAVYTKNHEGKRLSMRIGNKWRVVDPLSANYTRNLTKVGEGRTVTVMVYLDRVLVQVKQIKIQ